jgi:hypothetical protein
MATHLVVQTGLQILFGIEGSLTLGTLILGDRQLPHVAPSSTRVTIACLISKRSQFI